MRNNDFKILISDFSEFSTTFEDCLQNLTTVLKRCMVTNLVLIWKKCQGIDQQGIMSRLKLPAEPFMTLVEPLPEKEETPKGNPVILFQHIEHIEYIDLDLLESRPVLKLYLDLIIKQELLTIRKISYSMVPCRKHSKVDPESRRELQTHVKILVGIV